MSCSESLRLDEGFLTNVRQVILGNNRSNEVVSSVEMTIKFVVCFVFGLCIVSSLPNMSNLCHPLYIYNIYETFITAFMELSSGMETSSDMEVIGFEPI